MSLGHVAPASEASHPHNPRRWVFLAVAVPLFALFLATARTSLPYHIDAITNVFTAWSLGTNGTVILDEYEQLVEHRGTMAWIVDSPRGPVSQYPPGTALLTSPLYVMFPSAETVELRGGAMDADQPFLPAPMPSLWPAAIVAAGSTAAALGVLSVVVFGLGGAMRPAVLAGYIGGLGTSAWSVASDSLWQHGPGILWVALASWFISQKRWFSAGLAFSAVIVTRPPVAMIGAIVGLWLLTSDWRAAGRLLVGAMPGAVGIIAYNWWLFGKFTISGGYGADFTEQALGSDIGAYVENIWLALSHPSYGLFVFSAFLPVLLLVSRRAARSTASWPVIVALGGLATILLQLKANRASGGSDFHYYRYPLEPLMAAAPLLYVAWSRLWETGVLARLIVSATTLWSVVAHAYAVWRIR